MRIDVTGYTDSTGSEGYNQALSDRRADEVRIHLLRRGIDAARLTTSGRGESEPIADNATVEGRLQNRRIVVVVTIPAQ